MAGSINKVILIGNLGSDPEMRVSQDGKKIARLSLATNESWKDKSTGEKKEKTEWHKVVIFSPGLSDVAEKYLKKGSSVYIEGQIQTRKYTDQAGMEKYITEIVLNQYNSTLTMLNSKDNSFNDFSSPSLENSTPDDNSVPEAAENVLNEDEVPF